MHVESGQTTHDAEAPGFWRTYIFSTDHKMIAKQYLWLGLLMAVVGGFAAYLIRWQLAWPETSVAGWGFIEPDFYNALVTMHGTIMVFFVAMPILYPVGQGRGVVVSGLGDHGVRRSHQLLHLTPPGQ